MLDDAPLTFVVKLFPANAELTTRGRQYRMQLPSYLEQQRAFVLEQCPLPPVLQPLCRCLRCDHPGGHVGGRTARNSTACQAASRNGGG
jgi:hypothetical protein